MTLPLDDDDIVMADDQTVQLSRNTDKKVAYDPSSWQMFLMTLGQLGSIFAWTMEFSLTTPFFEKALSASKELSHAVWLLGPISGIVMGVLIGALSDRAGKRTPFILVFLLASVISMIAFGHAKQTWIAIISFGMCDFALNGSMWPLRALFSDSVSFKQQHEIQSWAAVNGALGEMLASLLVWTLGEPVAKMGFAMTTTAVVLTATTLCSTYFCDKWSHHESGEYEAINDDSVLDAQLPLDLYVPIEELPPFIGSTLNRVSWCLTGRQVTGPIPVLFLKHASVFGIIAFSFFCITPNLSSWFASVAFKGDPIASPLRYERGVAVFALANSVKSVVGLLFALVYPRLLQRVGAKALITGTYGALTVTLAVAGFFGHGNPTLAFLVVVVTAIPITAAFIVTPAIIVKHYSQARGTFLGVLNLFNVIPQLLDTLYTGRVARLYGEAAVVGYLGAGWALIGTLVARWIL